MKALLLRFCRDESGNSGLLAQVLLISGVSLAVVPTVDRIGAHLVEVFTKIVKAFP